ncbi:MAG: hypothetical protein U0745_02045 [Polyangia bacterium]|jgi:hypothetical protein
MGRALLGLIKGVLIGGGIGFALLKLNNPQGILAFVFSALLGAVVGLVCGQAPWRAATLWTPILKMVFGAAIGTGLYALGHRFMPSMSISIEGVGTGLSLRSAAVLAPIIGALYGLFVEFDDGGADSPSAPQKKSLPAKDLDL